MPARTPLSILRKKLNRQSQRDILREIRIKEKGGEIIDIFYGCPLEDEVRLSRIKLEKELDRTLFNNKIQASSLDQATIKTRRKTGEDRTKRAFLLSVLRSAKIRSKAMGIPFNLDIDDLVLPEKCPVFGTKIHWSNKITDDTPSLDRLVPSKGYVKGNVTFMSYKANRMKNNGTLQELEMLLVWFRSTINEIDIAPTTMS